MTTPPNSYVILHRKIAEDRRNKKISRNEYLVYVWLRNNANPYGISVTSLSDLNNDIFDGRTTTNSLNKIMLSLKKKRYLYYERRVGSRGSFNVKFPDFLLPTKKMTTYESISGKRVSRGPTDREELSSEEDEQTLEVDKQNSENTYDEWGQEYSSESHDHRSRGPKNETDTEKDIFSRVSF